MGVWKQEAQSCIMAYMDHLDWMLDSENIQDRTRQAKSGNTHDAHNKGDYEEADEEEYEEGENGSDGEDEDSGDDGEEDDSDQEVEEDSEIIMQVDVFADGRRMEDNDEHLDIPLGDLREVRHACPVNQVERLGHRANGHKASMSPGHEEELTADL